MMSSETPYSSAEPLHQIQDLCLDRHVERGCRLVGDDQLGIAAQRHGDHHALQHAAAELVRILPDPALRVRNADLLETPHRFLARCCAVHAKVQFQRLGQLAPDRENRVQRGHRLLIDHGDLLAADLADLGVGQLQQVLTVEDDLAADGLAGRVGTRRMIDRALTLLPQPLSPTRLSVSPSSIS